MKRTGKWFVRLLNVIFCSLMAAIIVGCILLRVFHISTYVVLSSSMEPGIRTGGIVLTQPAALDELEVGDVVTFIPDTTAKTTLVTHRIVRIDRENQNFGTKGDNNKVADNNSIPAENIKGKVIFTVPYVGYALTYLQEKPLILLWIPGIYFLILLLGAALRSLGKDEEEASKAEQIQASGAVEKDATQAG